MNAQENDAVNVVDPFGKVGSLSKTQASEALDSGYRLANADEVMHAKNETRFGGIQGSIFSGTLGAARTATLGLSDLALTSLPEGVGFSPEELKGFRETNPNSNLVGEVGGILRDPLGLAKVITSAGKATSAGTRAALKATVNASDASMVSKTLAGALGTATEAGLFGGVASTIDDYALGDPSLNGEKVLANVGFGALLGGTFGGITKVLGYGISPALRKAANSLGELRNELVGSGYGEESLVHKVLPTRFAEAIADRQLNLDTKGQAANLRKIVTNLNSITNHIGDEIKSFGSEVDPKAVSSLFKASAKRAGESQTSVANELATIVDQIKHLVPDEATKNSLESLKNKASFGSQISGSSENIFKSLGGLRGQISKLIEKDPTLGEVLAPINESIYNTMSNPDIFGPAGAASALHSENVSRYKEFISDTKSPTLFQKLFGEVKDGKWQFDINKMHDALSEKDIKLRYEKTGMLNDYFLHLQEMPENILNARRAIPNSKWRSQTLNQIIENSQKTHQEAFDDYIEGISKRRVLYGWRDYAPVLIAKWHPVLAAAIEAYDFYQDPVHATHGLSMVERMLGKTTKASLDLIDDVFNSSAVSRAAITEKARLPGSNFNVDKKDDDEDLKKKHKKIKRLVNLPTDGVAENLQKGTKGLSEFAPNISQHVHVTVNGAMSFLASKLPQSGEHLNPLSAPHEPSTNEMAKFERYRQIVENPLHSITQIKNRTITPETVETLNAVYPKLYQELKATLLEKVFDQKAKGKAIPYQTKQAISFFLGEPIEYSLSPQAILASQAIFASIPKPGQNQFGPQVKGLGKIKIASRSAVRPDED